MELSHMAESPPKSLALLFYFCVIAGGVAMLVLLSNIFLKLLGVPLVLYGLFSFIVTVDWKKRK
jgi:hypothetical protein